jgi:hypothetical protein
MELLDAPSRRAVRSTAVPAIRAGLAALVVLAPAAVALVVLFRPQWHPTGDMAQAELHVRGFWSHPPLVGAAGRIQDANGVQGSHPGPGLWLAMWPLYALAGSTSFGLMVSVTVVHLATVALALWLAGRRGGTSLVVLLAIALALVVRAGGPDMVTEPWNPWMGLFPFLVMLLALWSALEDDAWALPLSVVAGSYSLQTHAGYAVLVAGLCGGVAIVVARRWWRRGDRGRLATWFGVAVAAGVVVWLPPLIDQLRRQPGNVSILLDSFGNPDGPYLGLRRVVEITVVQFDVLGPWVFGPGRDDADAVAAVGFLAFVALWAAAVRSASHRRALDELRLHGLLGVAVVLAVVSISRIFGSFFEYTIRWTWVLTATVVAASLWSLWRGREPAARRRDALASRAGALAAACAVALVSLTAVQFATRAEPTGFVDGRIVAGLVPQVVDDLDPSARYLLRWWDPAVLGATGFGAVLELERRGFTVGVDAQFAAAALPHRVQPEQTATAVLYLVLGETSIERARSNPDVVELGAFDVRTPQQRRRSGELRAEIEAALSAAGQADRIALLDAYYGQAQLLFNEPAPPPHVRDLLGEYIDLRQPAAVFRAAPGTPVLPL